jgi:DNA-binding MarR family transcriptional regulator
MSEHFGNIQDLLKCYKKQKREGVMWLLCFLYSLNSMQSDGICTPSTHTLAIAGTTTRSDATIKRYLNILIDLNLIKREFPNGRTHILISTEYGQSLYNQRKQNPSLLKARSKIEPLNKTINHSLSIKHNYNHLGSNEIQQKSSYSSNAIRSKPELTKFDTLVLRSMLKKCTNSFKKLEKLEKEIKWSIEEGRLMCKRGTGVYHLTPDAIKIGVWLVKNGRWETPNGFEEWMETANRGKNYMQNVQKVIKRCEYCEIEDESVKSMLTKKKGSKYVCPSCYVKNLDMENDKILNMLKRVMAEECKKYTDIEFSYGKFKAFANNDYKIHMDERVIEGNNDEEPEIEEQYKELLTLDDIRIFQKIILLPEQFFRFHRKQL